MWAFVAGTVASVVVGLLVTDPTTTTTPGALIALLAAQDFGIIAYLAVVARYRGVGSLRADFGFTFRPAVGTWLGGLKWVLAGVALQLAALVPTALLEAAHGTTAKQDVVKTAEKAHSGEVVLMVLAVALLAPITEELLFRGAFLRSFERRMTPDRAVFAAAVLFGVVHLLGDPSAGSLVALPAIILLGLVSGYQAVKTGNLSRSMMLHIGFNALSAVLIFTT